MKTIAVIGRPNVGKSSLFNRLIQNNKAIVLATPGVTRDRIISYCNIEDHRVRMIDTGGILFEEGIHEQVYQQAAIAIEEADLVLFVVDVKNGVMPLDAEIALLLRKKKKQLLLVANKVDNKTDEASVQEFYKLGFEFLVGISAAHNLGIDKLREFIFDHLNLSLEEPQKNKKTDQVRIAIVGRPNVGKSTFINAIIQEDRLIVSPIAGTTTDSVDIDFKYADHEFTLIDTAGVRRRRSVHEGVERISTIMTEKSIENSHVCILIVDAIEGVTKQDNIMIEKIHEAGTGCVLVINKWDQVVTVRMEHYLKVLRSRFHHLNEIPVVFTSGLTGRNVLQVLDTVCEVYDCYRKIISTPQLNQWLQKFIKIARMPSKGAKNFKLFYGTQVGAEPPVFTWFVNNKDLLETSFMRNMERQLKEYFKIQGVPVRFRFQNRRSETEGARK